MPAKSSRRTFLKLSAAAASITAAELAHAAPAGPRVRIVTDPASPLISGDPVQWAIRKLHEAFTARGVVISDSGATQAIVVAPVTSLLAKPFFGTSGVTQPETTALIPGHFSATPATLVTGVDARGLVYGLLELADRIRLSDSPIGALHLAAPLIETTPNKVRSVARLFVSETEDKPWFYDRIFWTDYLDTLAAARFNRFNFSVGLGYDFPRGVTGDYLHFPYPYLVEVPGYPQVHVEPALQPGERQRNLETLQFIAAETARRSMDFQLGIWTHAYQWTDSPHSDHHIAGLTPQTHAAYCRDALAAVLKECPQITGLTLRIHGESGIPEGSYDFWQTLFEAVPAAGRTHRDRHARQGPRPAHDRHRARHRHARQSRCQVLGGAPRPRLPAGRHPRHRVPPRRRHRNLRRLRRRAQLHPLRLRRLLSAGHRPRPSLPRLARHPAPPALGRSRTRRRLRPRRQLLWGRRPRTHGAAHLQRPRRLRPSRRPQRLRRRIARLPISWICHSSFVVIPQQRGGICFSSFRPRHRQILPHLPRSGAATSTTPTPSPASTTAHSHKPSAPPAPPSEPRSPPPAASSRSSPPHGAPQPPTTSSGRRCSPRSPSSHTIGRPLYTDSPAPTTSAPSARSTRNSSPPSTNTPKTHLRQARRPLQLQRSHRLARNFVATSNSRPRRSPHRRRLQSPHPRVPPRRRRHPHPQRPRRILRQPLPRSTVLLNRHTEAGPAAAPGHCQDAYAAPARPGPDGSARKTVYATDVSYGSTAWRRGYWADRLPAIDADLEALNAFDILHYQDVLDTLSNDRSQATSTREQQTRTCSAYPATPCPARYSRRNTSPPNPSTPAANSPSHHHTAHRH